MNINTGKIFSPEEMKQFSDKDIEDNFVELSNNDLDEVIPMSHEARKKWASIRKNKKKISNNSKRRNKK